MVAIKTQKNLLAKQNKLLQRIADCQRRGEDLVLDQKEMATVERALHTHKAIIVLDLKKREEAKNG